MYWTLELAQYLSDAPWPATKDELIDYAIRTGAPLEVVENLQENRKSKTTKKFSKTFGTSGPTIPTKKISSGTKTNIKTAKTTFEKVSFVRLFLYKFEDIFLNRLKQNINYGNTR